MSGPNHCTRAFVVDGEVQYREAASFEVEVLEPVPVKLLPDDAEPVTIQKGEHVVYSFGRDLRFAGVP